MTHRYRERLPPAFRPNTSNRPKAGGYRHSAYSVVLSEHEGPHFEPLAVKSGNPGKTLKISRLDADGFMVGCRMFLGQIRGQPINR